MRTIVPTEMDKLQELEGLCYRHPLTPDESHELWRKTPRTLVRVHVVEGEIVGYVIYEFTKDHCFNIIRFGVHPFYTFRGFGKQLMYFLKNRKGIRQIRYIGEHTESTKPFLGKCGFVNEIWEADCS